VAIAVALTEESQTVKKEAKKVKSVEASHSESIVTCIGGLLPCTLLTSVATVLTSNYVGDVTIDPKEISDSISEENEAELVLSRRVEEGRSVLNTKGSSSAQHDLIFLG
jgi:hypothetical protein